MSKYFKEHILSLITGAILGGILSTTFEHGFWIHAGDIGSFLSGLGTIALIIIGWIKGNDWVKQIKREKVLALTIDTLNDLAMESESMFREYINHSFIHASAESNEALIRDAQKRFWIIDKKFSTLQKLARINGFSLGEAGNKLDDCLDFIAEGLNLEDYPNEYEPLQDLKYYAQCLNENVLEELLGNTQKVRVL